jgi:hypothetical protein
VKLSDAFDAFRLVLTGGILTTARISDSVRKNATGTPVRDNYVVVSDETPLRVKDRYTVQQQLNGRMRHRFDVRSVATAPSGRRMYQDAVHANLIGALPVLMGRECTPIEAVEPLEEGRPKYDSTADLYFAIDSFEFWSWPTTDDGNEE